MKEKTTKNK